MPDMGLQWIGTRIEDAGADTSVSRSTLITAGNSNAEGSWTQLIAATSFDYAAILIHWGLSNTLERFLLDIGVGAAASEVVIVSNLHSGDNAVDTMKTTFLPLGIPSGSRIAARAQNSATSATNQIRAMVQGIAANPRLPVPLGKCVSYGDSAGDSGGTSLDPGTTLNTKGAWAQLTASTTEDISWLSVDYGHDKATITANTNWLVDIGIGAAASEVVLLPNCPVSSNSSGFLYSPPCSLPVTIPVGTRLSARCQCSVTTATQRLLEVVVHGVG